MLVQKQIEYGSKPFKGTGLAIAVASTVTLVVGLTDLVIPKSNKELPGIEKLGATEQPTTTQDVQLLINDGNLSAPDPELNDLKLPELYPRPTESKLIPMNMLINALTSNRPSD